MTDVALIDTHCHLISYKYNPDDIPSLVQRSLTAGVSRMITLGTSEDDWDAHLQLAEAYPSIIYPCLGIHPGDVHEHDLEKSLGALEEKSSSILALGETGLDYFHPAPKGWSDTEFRKKQQESLEAHFSLAEKLGKNIVIHTRDKSGIASFEDTLAIYRPYADKVRACFHCFIGNHDQARQVFDLNGILSFTGITTFGSARDVLDVARKAPSGRFCLETDSPYLAPTPFRGQRNEPSYVRIIAEYLASARQESLESLTAHTTQTADHFFFSFPY